MVFGKSQWRVRWPMMVFCVILYTKPFIKHPNKYSSCTEDRKRKICLVYFKEKVVEWNWRMVFRVSRVLLYITCNKHMLPTQ